MKNGIKNRLLSLLLSVVIVLGLLPILTVETQAAVSQKACAVGFKLSSGDAFATAIESPVSVNAYSGRLKKDITGPTLTSKEFTDRAANFTAATNVPVYDETGSYSYPFSMTVTLKENCVLNGASLYNAAVASIKDTDTPTGITVSCVKGEGNQYTISFTPTAEITANAVGIVLDITNTSIKAEQYKVTFYPRLDASGKKIERTVEEGSTAAEPTDAELLQLDSSYFSIVEPIAWYTEKPRLQEDKSYLYNEDKVWDPKAPITGETNLYAKVDLREDAKVKVCYRIPKRVAIEDLNSLGGGGGNPSHYYNWDTSAVGATNTPANEAGYWKELPIGKPVGAGAVPDIGNGKYGEPGGLKLAEGIFVPENGAELTKWIISSGTEVYVDFTENTVIPAEVAISASSAGYITVMGCADFSCRVLFHSNLSGTAAPYADEGYPFVSTTTYYNQGFDGDENGDPWKTAREWIAEQEKKDGFNQVFRGWYLDAACSDDKKWEETNYTYSDLDVYAKWVDACTISYSLGRPVSNGTGTYDSYTAGTGDLLNEPEVPLASGAEFLGWYKDEAYTVPWNFDTDKVTGDTTLYAKWDSSRTITVVFRYFAPDDMTRTNPITLETRQNVPVSTASFGAVPALPAEAEGSLRKLTYTKWTFLDKDGFPNDLTAATSLSGKLPDDLETLTVTAAATPSFTFTFDTQGGTPVPNAQTVRGESGKATEPAVAPQKTGVEFDGWYEDAEGFTAFDFDKSHSQNTTIYAKWKGETIYTVTFDKSASPEAVIVLKKADAEIAADASSSGNLVVYKLAKNRYTYTISAAGYKTVAGNLTIDNNSNVSQTIPVVMTPFVPVTDVVLDGLAPRPGRSYTLSRFTKVSPENASVKTVTWPEEAGLPDGVTLADGVLTLASTVAQNTQITLTAAVAGGKLSADGSTEEPFTKKITLHAGEPRYQISFATGNDGPAVSAVIGLPSPVEADTNGKITIPASPTASGWNFTEWYTDAACKTEWDPETPFTQDATLYAGWEKMVKEVTVTFAGGTGAAANSGAVLAVKGNAGDSIMLPACMFTRSGYVFRAWKPGTAANIFAGAEYILPNDNITLTAQWTAVGTGQTADDITHSLDGITASNAVEHRAQIESTVMALAQLAKDEASTQTNSGLVEKVEELFEAANPGAKAEIKGDASSGAGQTGAILSSDGTKNVELNIKAVTASKALPQNYKEDRGYTAVYRDISLLVGGVTVNKPKVPIVITLPIPGELKDMAADTIRVLHYKGASATPTEIIPQINTGKAALTFVMDSFSQVYFVGKAVSDNADTSVSGLVMKYEGSEMGRVTQDDQGNFTVTLPATTSESIIGDLQSGIGSKWITYITAAAGSKIKESGSGGIAEQTADYWRDTGICIDYALDSKNNYSQTRNFTITAKDGTTSREFSVTVKKITTGDQTLEINTKNIVGGTVTAKPNPAAPGEDVKLTITPDEGKKLAAGSLSWCLQSAGAEQHAIDETTLTFTMPEGAVNINAQFVTDSSGSSTGEGAPQITSFIIGNASGAVNNDTRVITIVLPYGTDLGNVAPMITGQNISKIVPASATRVDLRSPKTYTVYGTDGSSVSYTVSAYTEDPNSAQILWERLQEQIRETGNWWDLAERQKVRGVYGVPTTQPSPSSLGTYVDDITGQNGSRRVNISYYLSGNLVVLEPSSRTLTGSGWKNFIELPRYTLTDLERLGYDGIVYGLGEISVEVPVSMETAKGFKITVSEASSTVRQKWSNVRNRIALYDISASSTRKGLSLTFDVGSRAKSDLKLMKYEPTKGGFVEVDRDLWTVSSGYLVTDPLSAGVYGIARR